METFDPREGPFGLWRLDWQDLCRGPLDIASYQLYQLLAPWFQSFPIISI